MKIAIITPGFLPVPAVKGGAVENLIQFIVDENEIREDFDIELYTIYDGNIKNQNHKKTIIKYVTPNMKDKAFSIVYNRWKMLVSIFNKKIKGDYISPYSVNIKRLLRHTQYDYVIIENNMTVVNSLKNYNNLVFHLHNDILGSDKPLYQCELLLEKCMYVLSVSNYIKERLLLVNKDAYEKICILPNCINIENFNYDGPVNKVYNFFFSGRIVPEKGVLELINAFKHVYSVDSHCTLTIVGKSVFNKDELTAYENEVKNAILGYEDVIIFTGFIQYANMPNILKKADCVIIPSKLEESFGLVALEAMACRKPIISTISGGIVEILDESFAVFVDKDNLENELQNEMLNALRNTEEYRVRGNIGHTKLLMNNAFSIEGYYQLFKNTLHSSLDKK